MNVSEVSDCCFNGKISFNRYLLKGTYFYSLQLGYDSTFLTNCNFLFGHMPTIAQLWNVKWNVKFSLDSILQTFESSAWCPNPSANHLTMCSPLRPTVAPCDCCHMLDFCKRICGVSQMLSLLHCSPLFCLRGQFIQLLLLE